MTHTLTDEQGQRLGAPPRLLLWGAFVALLLIVLAVIGAGTYLAGGQRLSTLLPFALLLAVILPVLMLGTGILFRRQLPRLFLPGTIVVIVIAGIAGLWGGTSYYRNNLPPRYQEELTTPFPFLRAFMAPTPAGGLVPTVGVVGGALSADDLLAMPLSTTVPPTAQALIAPALTQEATLPLPSATPPPSATPSPTATLTPAPTQTALIPTGIPTTSPTLAATLPPEQSASVNAATSTPPFHRPAANRIYGIRPQLQDWNNCGAANITMALSAFGWTQDFQYAAQYLRPDAEDKNVSPNELVNFVNQYSQVRAVSRIGGDLELLKMLIAANFPVLVETTYTPEGYDWIGHYHTVVAYDDSIRSFYVYDSYLGTGAALEGLIEQYDSFDSDWQAFNRVFIVIYQPQDEALLSSILGERIDPTRAAELALQNAQREARSDPENPFPWFNMGSSFVRLGEYDEAAVAYDRSRRQGLPFRINWYQFGMFEAYFNVGRYDDVMAIVQTNLTTSNRNVEETYYWQGRVYEAQGQRAEAIAAYQRALAGNRLYAAAQEALDRVNT